VQNGGFSGLERQPAAPDTARARAQPRPEGGAAWRRVLGYHATSRMPRDARACRSHTDSAQRATRFQWMLCLNEGLLAGSWHRIPAWGNYNLGPSAKLTGSQG